MWGNWEHTSILAGVQKRLTISCKVRRILTKDLAVMLLYIFPREMKLVLTQKPIYKCLYKL